MKITKFFFLFSLVVAMVSCNKDDDNGQAAYDLNKENLTGSYSLNFFESKKIETVKVSGFDVITTTTSTGDTFDARFEFATNNTVTSNGTYRITQIITQGNQTTNDARIIVLNNEVTGYSVNPASSELTIDGSTYRVSDFSPTGFTIKISKTTTEPNGDSYVYTEERRFKK